MRSNEINLDSTRDQMKPNWIPIEIHWVANGAHWVSIATNWISTAIQ
jgi:hypothetical protein